jgi:hypothetical protein
MERDRISKKWMGLVVKPIQLIAFYWTTCCQTFWMNPQKNVAFVPELNQDAAGFDIRHFL